MRLFLICVLFVSSFSFLIAQDTNKIVHDEKSGKPMLIGPCTREALTDTKTLFLNIDSNTLESDCLMPLEGLLYHISHNN